jgi:hypothetical protein
VATIKRVRTFVNPTRPQVMRLKELEIFFREQEESEDKAASLKNA